MSAIDELLLDRIGAPSGVQARCVVRVATVALTEVEACCERFSLLVEKLTPGDEPWITARVSGPRHAVVAFDELARSCRGLGFVAVWARS